jgi:TonB-linked SusC/RagA family outer membrane protein
MYNFTRMPANGISLFFALSKEAAAPKPKTIVHSSTCKTLVRAVKLTVIIMLVGLLQVSARTTAQTRISINLRGATLEKVFSEIEKRSGYTVFYNTEVLKAAGSSLVSLEMKDATIEDVMHQCLKGLPLEFLVQDKTIFVKKEARRAAVEPVPGLGSPEPSTFSGVVRAEGGAPLMGATVFIAKLNKTLVTNKDGEFILKNLPDGVYEVEISFIGYESYKTKIAVVNHEARLTADLKQSTSKLDETVVKGYYNTTDRLNTGDVTTVKAEDIQKQPVSDPIQALEGRVPGLYIQQTSGAPGSYATIQIRGQNSIANGNDPLYIVDGVPFSSVSLSSPSVSAGPLGYSSNISNAAGGGMSPFNSLNPADIESITVLKDADATAIYGSRGANGVILITTKRGKAGNTRFDLNVYTGGGEVTRMMHLLNTQQYLTMRHEAYANDGITTIPSNAYDLNGVWDTTRYTNWQKLLIGNTANFTNAQANVSGGDANTQFVVGGGYSNQGTAFVGDYSDQKATGHLNLTHSSTDQRFHLLIGANYGYDNSNLPVFDFTRSIILAPDAPAVYKNGNLNWQIVNGTATWSNPIAPTYAQCKSTTTNLISNLNLSYRLLPGLQIKSNFGYNKDEMNEDQIGPATTQAPPYNTQSTSRSYTYATSNFTTWIIEPQLDYQTKVGQGRIEALVGGTFQQRTQTSLTQYAYGFSSDYLITNPQAATYQQLLGSNYTLYRYEAIYGRLSYNWNDKYLVNVTARRDGSSRFGPGKQFGNFGAAGLGWVFSREGFVRRNLTLLSFGKLRVSYGATGNDQITDYRYLSSYSATSTSYQGLTGLTPSRLSNPYFAWEVVKKLEGGIELGFVRDRILLSASYFRDRTGNQLVGAPLPALTGFTTVQYNLPAVVQNTGVELGLNIINIKGKDFTWTTTANLTVPNNKLVAFPNIKNSVYANTYVVGKSLFIWELYHSTGVNPQTGLYSFATKNANGAPSSPQDLVATKPVTQKYYGSIGNTFNYKSFQLDIFFQYVNQLGFNYKNYFASPGLINGNEPTAVLNRWQAIGNLTSTQRFGSTSTVRNSLNLLQQSDGIITDASFLRLKNMALSYQLPANWKGRLHLQSARLYVQCQNLITVTHYLGLDPETGGLNLPPLRMVTAGVQVSL